MPNKIDKFIDWVCGKTSELPFFKDFKKGDMPQIIEPDAKSAKQKYISDLESAIKKDEEAQVKQQKHEEFILKLQEQERLLASEIVKMKNTLSLKREELIDLQREIIAAIDFHYDVSDATTIEVAKETLEKLKDKLNAENETEKGDAQN